MHRTQLMIEKWQYQRLRTRAEREGKSISELTREALTAFLESPSDGRRRYTLDDIDGIGSDPDCSGRDHDDFLYSEP